MRALVVPLVLFIAACLCAILGCGSVDVVSDAHQLGADAASADAVVDQAVEVDGGATVGPDASPPDTSPTSSPDTATAPDAGVDVVAPTCARVCPLYPSGLSCDCRGRTDTRVCGCGPQGFQQCCCADLVGVNAKELCP